MELIGIIITYFLGASILQIVSNKFSILEILGFSFLIGIGIQTFLMFFFNFLGILYNINLIFISSIFLILLVIIKIFIHRKYSILEYKKKIKDLFVFHKLVSYNVVWLSSFSLVVFIVYSISTKSLFWPTFASDSLGSFDVFAKGLALEGKIINSLILEKRVGYGVAYPPLYSLALAYSYILGFELSKIIPVLFFVSFPISFYTLIKKLTNPTNAMFFTLFAIASPELLAQSTINITSFPHAVYISLGVISIIVWHKIQEYKYFYLSAILLSFAAFTRSETVVYILPILFLLFLFIVKTKEYRNVIFYSCIMITPFILWQIFLAANINIMEKYVQVELIKYPNFNFNQISKIFTLAMLNIKSTQYFGITFPIFIITMVLNGFNIIKKKDNLWLLSIIFLSFFGYLLLLNQLKLKSDTLDNIINYSGKRFFFGTVLLMWFYIASNAMVKEVFYRLESLLNLGRIKNK